MGRKLIKVILILILISCNQFEYSKSQLPVNTFPKPVQVNLNIENGYLTNVVSGDTIQSCINSFGNTIITGVPVRLKSTQVSPQNVAFPKVLKAGSPTVFSANPNLKKIPETLPIISLNDTHFKIFEPGTLTDNSSFFVLNSIGDTIETGLEVEVQGRTVPCIQPYPVNARLPKRKDNANNNIQFLDVEQGMNSSYVLCLLEDSYGNIWMGTNEGGVSRYNGITFTHFTEKEGLCNNSIWAIFEDSAGNIWFGTSGGVCKYNGDNFTWFTEKEGLANNHILSILEDNAGNLWFGTNGSGVCKFNGKSFTHFSKKQGLVDNVIRTIYEDSKGNIWFGTFNGGVSKYDGNYFTNFTEEEGLSNNCVMPILEDYRGNIWFGTWGGGVNKYDGNTITRYSVKEGLIHNYVNSIIEDDHKNLWFGTWEGVSKFDGETFTNFSENDGLSYNDAYSALKDSKGNIWFGTWGGGVIIIRPEMFVNLTKSEGLYDNHIFSALEDRQGNLWFGSWHGVTKYNGETYETYTQNEGLSHNYVYSILEDHLGNIWFGTAGGGVNMYDGKSFTIFTEKEGLRNELIYSMIEDKEGSLWFGTLGGGVSIYKDNIFSQITEKEGLSNNNVNAILEDRKGNIWIGTNNGLCKYKNETITVYTEKEGLSSNKVFSVIEDWGGNIWLGTSAGLTVFTGDKFIHYTEKEGICNNLIQSVVEDNNHNIWVSTKKGISRLEFNSREKTDSDLTGNVNPDEAGSFNIDLLQTRIHSYNELDGLKATDFYQNSVLMDSKNQLWWGSGKSLAMLDLNRYKIYDESPCIQIERVDINDEFIDFRHSMNIDGSKLDASGMKRFYNYPLNLKLPHNLNYLTFYFSAIDWSAPYKIKYSYKMEGLNTDWIPITTEAKADYRNLPYGSYTFKVRAIGEAQIWSEPFSYSFRINPPWFDTWLAKIFFLILVLFAVFGLVQLQTFRLNKRRNELLKIVEELQVAKLKAEESDQLKSAFLLNLSHEIRTPMNGILGFTSLLNQEGLSGEEQQRYIGIIQKSGTRMINTVTDLVQISQIETGQVDVILKEVNVIELTNRIFETFISDAEEKGLKLIKQFSKNEEILLKTDGVKLEIILKNLLSNAIKYTESGTIEIGIKRSERKSNEFIEFYVSDTGIGIPEHRRNAIFNRFEQADVKDKKAKQGTGLGLSIAKAYVKKLGGDIWLESNEMKGTTFYFSLPFIHLSEETVSTNKLETKDSFKARVHKFKALIAEDDEYSAMHISILLEEFTTKIILAKNGIEAIELFQKNPDVELILMDIRMPQMDGYEATKKIRELNKNVIIIAQTANALLGDSDKALAVGCNDYIAKPINKDLLFAKIGKWMES